MRKRSIVNIFISFGIIGFLLILGTFAGMFVFFQRQSQTQKEFIDRVSLTNGILVSIEESKSYLNQYRHDWDKNYYSYYRETTAKLALQVQEYLEKHSQSAEGENYQAIRRLSNFIAYQDGMLSKAGPDTAALYNETSYLLQGFSRHQDEVFNILQSDLKNGYDEYFEAEAQNLTSMVRLLTFLGFSLVLLVLFVIRYQHQILAYMDKVTANLSAISHHRWSVEDMNEDTYREFRELSTGVNEMKQRLHEYFLRMEKQSETELKLREEMLRNEQQKAELIKAQMDTLKAQINPHFLFNSLHQIGMASLVEKPKTILDLVEATGKILRYSIYNKDTFVPLQEELDIVSTYVYLQRQYSGRNIVFTMDFDEDSLDLLVMPMCIQPIVENSFKHGLAPLRDREWELRLRGWIEEDGSFSVSIRDNGVGMKEKRDDKQSGIGLSNIRRRMELEFGRDDLMTIRTEEGKYTEIILRFPEVRKEI